MAVVKLPNGETAKFPDSFTPEQIDEIVYRDFSHLFESIPQTAAASTPMVSEDGADNVPPSVKRSQDLFLGQREQQPQLTPQPEESGWGSTAAKTVAAAMPGIGMPFAVKNAYDTVKSIATDPEIQNAIKAGALGTGEELSKTPGHLVRMGEQAVKDVGKTAKPAAPGSLIDRLSQTGFGKAVSSAEQTAKDLASGVASFEYANIAKALYAPIAKYLTDTVPVDVSAEGIKGASKEAEEFYRERREPLVNKDVGPISLTDITASTPKDVLIRMAESSGPTVAMMVETLALQGTGAAGKIGAKWESLVKKLPFKNLSEATLKYLPGEAVGLGITQTAVEANMEGAAAWDAAKRSGNSDEEAFKAASVVMLGHAPMALSNSLQLGTVKSLFPKGLADDITSASKTVLGKTLANFASAWMGGTEENYQNELQEFAAGNKFGIADVLDMTNEEFAIGTIMQGTPGFVSLISEELKASNADQLSAGQQISVFKKIQANVEAGKPVGVKEAVEEAKKEPATQEVAAAAQAAENVPPAEAGPILEQAEKGAEKLPEAVQEVAAEEASETAEDLKTPAEEEAAPKAFDTEYELKPLEAQETPEIDLEKDLPTEPVKKEERLPADDGYLHAPMEQVIQDAAESVAAGDVMARPVIAYRQRINEAKAAKAKAAEAAPAAEAVAEKAVEVKAETKTEAEAKPVESVPAEWKDSPLEQNVIENVFKGKNTKSLTPTKTGAVAEMNDGKKINLVATEKIDLDPVALQRDYGMTPEEAEKAGKYSPGTVVFGINDKKGEATILLRKPDKTVRGATKSTLDHEVLHVAFDSVLNNTEKAKLLSKHWNRVLREGGVKGKITPLQALNLSGTNSTVKVDAKGKAFDVSPAGQFNNPKAGNTKGMTEVHVDNLLGAAEEMVAREYEGYGDHVLRSFSKIDEWVEKAILAPMGIKPSRKTILRKVRTGEVVAKEAEAVTEEAEKPKPKPKQKQKPKKDERPGGSAKKPLDEVAGKAKTGKEETVKKAVEAKPSKPIKTYKKSLEERTKKKHQLSEDAKKYRDLEESQRFLRAINVPLSDPMSLLNFDKWFDKSVVVTADGTPKVLFSGSRSGGFTVYDREMADEWSIYGKAFYATEDIEVAEDEAIGLGDIEIGLGPEEIPGSPVIMPVYLSLKKPFDMDAQLSKQEIDNLISMISGFKWKSPAFTETVKSKKAMFKPGMKGSEIHLALQRMADDNLSKTFKTDFNDMLLQNGWDAIKYTHQGKTAYAVFRGGDIKSSIANNGLWAPHPDPKDGEAPTGDIIGPSIKHQLKEIEGPNGMWDDLSDSWFAGKDTAKYLNQVESLFFTEKLAEIAGEKSLAAKVFGSGSPYYYGSVARKMDAAMHVWLDVRNEPEWVDKNWDSLPKDKQELFEEYMEIMEDKRLQDLALQIEASYKEAGEAALSSEIIYNLLPNYVNRVWRLDGKKESDVSSKFNMNSRHANKRVFGTILDGWAAGYELRLEGAVGNLQIYKDEIAQIYEDRALMKKGRNTRIGDSKSPTIFSHKKPNSDYIEIVHPNFSYYVPFKSYIGNRNATAPYKKRMGAGLVESVKYAVMDKKGNTKGVFDNFHDANVVKQKGDRIEERINVLQRKKVYAHKSVAVPLNKIFGPGMSAAFKGGGDSWLGNRIDDILKYNSIIKSSILLTSFFHHLAYMRSYFLGTSGVSAFVAKDKNGSYKLVGPRGAMMAGIESIKQMTPEIMYLVRNGLNLDVSQDFDMDYLEQSNFLSKIGRKYLPGFTESVSNARKRQTQFLFKRLGSGLKAQAALIEFQHNLNKFGPQGVPVEKIAKATAEIINNDFGGLHLDRLGRSTAHRQFMRAALLAPDWCCEGSTRAMTKTGWKYHNELSVGDEIMAFDPESKKIKWSKLKDMYVNAEYSGDMVEIKNHSRKISVTPHHKCYIKNFTTGRNDIVLARDLQTNSVIPRCADFELPEKDCEEFDDFFIKMVGWLVTDGYIKKTTNAIADGSEKEYRYGKITQSKPHTVKMLIDLGLNYYSYKGKDHDGIVSNYDTHIFTIPTDVFRKIESSGIVEKSLTWEFLSKLSKRQLELLYETMMLGDGTGQRRFCGQEKEIFYMTMIQTLLGLPSTFYQQEEKCWRTRVISSENIYTKNKSIKHYDGTIWCPSVNEGFWLAENNGLIFITGNTESNVRTLTGLLRDKHFKGEKAMYRAFWINSMIKGVALTTMMNLSMLALSRGLEDKDEWRTMWERYKLAWRQDPKKLRWMMADMSPAERLFRKKIYDPIIDAVVPEALKNKGMFAKEKDDRPYYFSLLGHFLDPVKWGLDPVSAVKHKGSPAVRLGAALWTKSDWKDDRFTTLDELMGTDDKGTYRTDGPDHKKGDPKGGKNKWKLTARYGKPGSDSTVFPSLVASEAIGMMPIQMQEAVRFSLGQTDAVDALSKMIGLHTSRGSRSEYDTAHMVMADFKEDVDALSGPGRQQYLKENEPKAKIMKDWQKTHSNISILNKKIKNIENNKKLTETQKAQMIKDNKAKIKDQQKEFLLKFRRADK